MALEIYKATAGFPREETYGLTSQVRRACASIPANIAEGCGRNGVAELARFFHIAMGSASELQYHLILARDLGFLPQSSFNGLMSDATEVKRMLGTYLEKIRASQKSPLGLKDVSIEYLTSDI